MKLRLTSLLGSSMLVGVMTVSAACLAPAAAQDSASRIQNGPIVEGTGTFMKQRGAPPPGLPGAATGRDRVSPADHPATDMRPNDALFDSINRGDITGARDALSRGADFNARNVLGMTPLDQSIDLGRNDITFLLLSLRGSAPRPESPAQANAGGKGAKPPRRETAANPAPGIRSLNTRQVSQQTSPRPVAAAQQPSPGDNGTPNPQSGFLGFGG